MISKSNEKVKKKSTINKTMLEDLNLIKPKINDKKNEFLKYLISKRKNYQEKKFKLMVSSLAYYEEDNILAIATIDRNVHVKHMIYYFNITLYYLF